MDGFRGQTDAFQCFLIEVLQYFAGSFDWHGFTQYFKTVAAVADFDRQPLLNLTQVFVKLTAEIGQGLGIVWFQSQNLLGVG